MNLNECYKLFGLKHIKETDEIDLKKRYRKLAMKFHPDKGGKREQFQFIQNSYECLIAECQMYSRKQRGIRHTVSIDKQFYHYGDGSIFDTEKNRWKRYKKHGMWFIWDYIYIKQVKG